MPTIASAKRPSLRRTAASLTGRKIPAATYPLKRPLLKLLQAPPYVIRQKIPHEGNTTFSDAIFGDITVENNTLDDQVLIKPDGLPTYNLPT